MHSNSETTGLISQQARRHYNPSYQRTTEDGARDQETGIRGLYRFENQHGASVIYAHPLTVNQRAAPNNQCYELAHVQWEDELHSIHSWVFAYTPYDEPEITTCLTEDEVQQELDRIAGL